MSSPFPPSGSSIEGIILNVEQLAQDVATLTRALLRYGAALAAEVGDRTGARDVDRHALQLLDELEGAPGAPLTPAVLAERLELSRSATTALLDRLERAGLVERVRDLPDRRQVRLALTPGAREAGGRVLGPVARRIDAAAASLDTQGVAAVHSFLDAVLTADASPSR